MTPITMRTVSVATLLFAAAATYAHADSQNSVPMSRETWPASVVYDVARGDCDKMGGQLGGNPMRGIQVCYISAASCESHAGFKVVMRDAFTIGGSRLAACRKMS
jgi:hypothetical protein